MPDWKRIKERFSRGLDLESLAEQLGAILNHVIRIVFVLGGMHLTGGLFDARIPDTVAAFIDLAPDVVVPGHCSGWKATHTMARAMPDAFVCTSVGTRLRFAASEPEPARQP